MDDLVEKKIYYCDLYNIYSALLSNATKERFYLFYFEDYSLSEIAEKENISKNAVFLSIKNGEKELNLYENKLKLYVKKKSLLDNIDKILFDNHLDKEIIEKIKGEIKHGI